LTPLAIEVDAQGHARGLRVSAQHNDGDGVWHEYAQVVLPARTILIAAGTQPNTVLCPRRSRPFSSRRQVFPLRDEAGTPVHVVRGLAKPEHPAVLTDIRADGRATRLLRRSAIRRSRAHVVKAMASAKQGYPIVSRAMNHVHAGDGQTDAEFFALLDAELRATVVKVERLTPTIVEVIVHAGAAARRFRPGQFYRLQNFESLAPVVDGTAIDHGRTCAHRRVGRSRAGSRVDDRARNGRLIGPVHAVEAGEPVVLMGPTGTPTEIEPGETVVLAGGRLGNAVLFSIGQAYSQRRVESALLRRATRR